MAVLCPKASNDGRDAIGDDAGAVPNLVPHVLDEAEAFVRRHTFVFRMGDVAAAQVLTSPRLGN